MSAKYTFAVYSTIVGSAKEKLVLLKLADNANDNGVCWPAMGYLQKHTELSRSSLLRSLKSLEDKGFIRVTRRKTEDRKQNLSNVYQLTLPSVTMELPQYQDDTTPSVIVTPKSNNIESKKESNKEIQDLFNSIIDKEKPNWSKLTIVSDARKSRIKKLINFAKKRIKIGDDQNEQPIDYLERLLSSMANDEFYSGKNPSAQYPNGYRWNFDQVANESNIIKFIEKVAE